MKKSMKVLAVLIIAVALFTSCSTTIYASIERPAELDLNGAESIAVLPIQISEASGNIAQNILVVGDVINFFNDLKYTANGSYDVAEYLTRNLEQGIAGSDYLDLIYSDAVKSALDNGKKAPCDVYLTGYISQYDTDIKQIKRTEKINGVNTKVPYYYREVSFLLTYQIIDSSSNRIITTRTQDVYVNSEEMESEDEVPEVMPTIRSMLDEVVDSIIRKVQPYTETKYISLLRDKSKDPDMKTADKYVKNGLLDAGRELYLRLYETRGYFEAGYNAAIILEAQGKYQEAYEEMQALVKRTGDSRAVSALNDIQYEINSKKALQEQLDK